MALGKKMLLLAAFCGTAWGQTGLTTIQDTLFKADGTRFNGTLTIQWSTFDTTSPGTVAQQSRSVAVVNGNLQVSLVPNAAAQPPANVYTVQYQSDGFQQFSETWSVPASTTSLRVSAVRTSTVSTGGGTGTGGTGGSLAGNQTPILESTVIGLQADLAQRPIKGVGFGTNRVALVNDSGQIETVVGDVGDCVFVDGTAGPCTPLTFADAETPGGIVDGTNNTLTLANTPLGSSLMLFRNGLFMTPGFDYTVSGASIHFVAGAVPKAGDTLTASYRVDTSAPGNIGALSLGSQTPQAHVLCSGAGVSSASTVLATLGACEVPVAALQPGDRIEIRFTFAHTGTVSGMSLQVNWGTTPILSRSGVALDTAVTGRAEASVSATGAQISTESWGTVMSFLPGIVTASLQAGLRVNFRAAMLQAGTDRVSLTNYTVLRYPAN